MDKKEKEKYKAVKDYEKAEKCTCIKPLLGYRPGVGPRCRLCNRLIK